MENEKLYLDNNLSLKQLSEKLDIHPNYLSQIINERLNKNFYDFVNEYRVNEFKKITLLPKNKNFTLLSLAYDCGFNSKSSFNNVFKKFTKQTPSEFLKNPIS